MFQIVGYIERFAPSTNTQHVTSRSKRLQIAQQLIVTESAKVCCIAIVNKGHKNGSEVHVIYNNGIIKIYNANTHKFITVLIAREPQIKRYQIKVTKTMLKKIDAHVANGYNNIAF